MRSASHSWQPKKNYHSKFRIKQLTPLESNFRFRIHEEKKKRISFPMSNPRFQEPNSPVEKIKTPGPAK